MFNGDIPRSDDRINTDGREKTAHGDLTFPVSVHKTKYFASRTVTADSQNVLLYVHWHSEAEILYITHGKCSICIEKETYEISEGDCVFIRPNMIHWLYNVGLFDYVEFYSIVFNIASLGFSSIDTINMKYITPIIMGERKCGPVFNDDGAWQRDIIKNVRDIFDLYDYKAYDEVLNNGLVPTIYISDDVVCGEIIVKCRLLEIIRLIFLNSVSNEVVRKETGSGSERIRKAILYIHDHYTEDFTLADLAGSVYMSKEYFSHQFKKHTGIQPFTYINNYRIQKSLPLLQNTDMKIIDIANSCGFNYVNYYNRKFYEVMKCTPLEYRRAKKIR